MASEHKPSIIYIDDVDALSNSEQAPDLEEPNKAKTEFIAQLAGMDSASGKKLNMHCLKRVNTHTQKALAFLIKRYLTLSYLETR